MIKTRFNGTVYKGTLAEFNASTRKWKLGDLLMPTDSPEVRYGNGTGLFSELGTHPATDLQKAAFIAILGATTNISALVVTAANISNSNAALSTSNTYTDSAVKTAIDGATDALRTKLHGALDVKADNADVELFRTQSEARHDASEGKIDAIIAALIAADLMEEA